MYSLVAVGVTTVAGFVVSSDMLSLLQADLGFDLHALTAYEAFYTQFSIALLVGVLLALPVLLYQLLQFAKPGLRPHEYRAVRNFLPFSIGLFILGAGFAYHVIVKNALEFFQTSTASADVAAVWGLQHTIGFTLKLSALTGLLFQLPVVATAFARAGLLTAAQMRTHRTHFFISVLVVAAMATPPDILTQLLVTVPGLGLYQVSILFVARLQPVK